MLPQPIPPWVLRRVCARWWTTSGPGSRTSVLRGCIESAVDLPWQAHSQCGKGGAQACVQEADLGYSRSWSTTFIAKMSARKRTLP